MKKSICTLFASMLGAFVGTMLAVLVIDPAIQLLMSDEDTEDSGCPGDYQAPYRCDKPGECLCQGHLMNATGIAPGMILLANGLTNLMPPLIWAVFLAVKLRILMRIRTDRQCRCSRLALKPKNHPQPVTF